MLFMVVGAVSIGLCLGLLGSGGSITTFPIFFYLLQRPYRLALTESTAVVGAVALFGAILYGIKRQISWRVAAFFGPLGMLGALSGAKLSHFVEDRVQITLFALTMLTVCYSLRREAPLLSTSSNSLLASLGLLTGFLTGFMGVGGGFLLVPILAFTGLTMRAAVGTSLLIISLNALSSFFVHLREVDSRSIDWSTVALFSLLGALGLLLGSLFNKKLPQEKLKKLFIVALAFLASFILLQEYR